MRIAIRARCSTTGPVDNQARAAAADCDGTTAGARGNRRYLDGHRDRTWLAMAPTSGLMTRSIRAVFDGLIDDARVFDTALPCR